ncbi:hypothetical protein [Sphaerisporangium aureirubrum]|uniref:PadR family transcriptional regulator n=1 Tax=Sphaerisporangium aureirubrum TaxID=1544736 RepID=A0ABW1NDJ2_9ACTN
MIRRPRLDGTTRHLDVLLLVLLAGTTVDVATLQRLIQVKLRRIRRWLTHLHNSEWLTTTQQPPARPGDPSRTLYRLTTYGRGEALTVLGLQASPDEIPTEVLPIPGAPCGPRRCPERDRATEYHDRLLYLQGLNMAADWPRSRRPRAESTPR